MAELPPVAHCDSVKPEQGYRSQYVCISYLARAVGDYDNGPNDRGRFWHAEVKVPEGSAFAEFDFAITLPPDLSRRFRIQSIKQSATPADGKTVTSYSFTLYGTSSYGNCKPGNETCVIQRGFKGTLFYR